MFVRGDFLAKNMRSKINNPNVVHWEVAWHFKPRKQVEVEPMLGFKLQFSLCQRWLAMQNRQHFAHPKNVGPTCCV